MTPLFNFLKAYIHYRLSKALTNDAIEIPELHLEDNTSVLAEFIKEEQLTTEEIIILLLAIIPEIQPGFINTIITEFLPNGGDLPEFGGIKGKNHRGILPTGETALYILYGTNIENRLQGIQLILGASKLFKNNTVYLDVVPANEPFLSGRLIIDNEYLAKLTLNTELAPKLGQDFPAERIETTLEWDDLVLNQKTRNHINDILIWLQFNHTILEDFSMKGKIKPGYRVMFFGPPGVGKTLTAGLLGKQTNKDVYRIDLSLVVSKYIGETEKNLSKLFDKAKNKDWILFFDEADAIFGKRTGVRDAHDKYANQEVSYLLQRIEAHPGLVLLASNYKSNIDKAFTRRFQSIIEFENPNKAERAILWRNNIPEALLTDSLDIETLAKNYELTGANIVNIVQQACLQMLANGKEQLTLSMLTNAIKREYVKEERML